VLIGAGWTQPKHPFRVQWNPSHKEGEGKNLTALVPERKGPWEFSSVFRDVTAAHEWGLTPDQFWEHSLADQALMIAFVVIRGDMEYYEEKNRPPSSTPGSKVPKP